MKRLALWAAFVLAALAAVAMLAAVGEPVVPEGGFTVVTNHRATCKLPIDDVIVGVGPNGAVLTITHWTHSRGKRHEKMCHMEIL